MSKLNKKDIEFLVNLTINAGKIAMKHFGSKDLQINKKSDDSPVTNADIEVSKFIGKNLKENFPDIDVVCEENDTREIKSKKFWLIDPIDGTKSFAKTNEEFTINIGLIENKKPVFGIIYAPAVEGSPLFYTNSNESVTKILVAKNLKENLKKKRVYKKEFTIISGSENNSKEILDYVENELKVKKKINIKKVSSSLKFCYVIDGKCDLYLHFRKSMEWDTAAGQSLIQAWGGIVKNIGQKGSLKYKKFGLVNGAFLVK